MRPARRSFARLRTSTLPRSSRATRRGSRAKKSRSSGSGFGVELPRISDIFRLIVKGGAGRKGELLVLVADLTDHIVPTVVPTEAGFIADDSPSSVARASRFAGLSVNFESDEESAAGAVASTGLPLAQELFRSHCGIANILVLDARDLRHQETLLVAVFEGNHDGGLVVLRRGLGLGVGAMSGNDERPNGKNDLTRFCMTFLLASR